MNKRKRISPRLRDNELIKRHPLSEILSMPDRLIRTEDKTKGVLAKINDLSEETGLTIEEVVIEGKRYRKGFGSGWIE